jgi:tetratricopeptide (TPR) repeat protein
VARARGATCRRRRPPLDALAHHFYHAAVLGEAANAVGYAVRAAERAMTLAAYEEGLAHYERALQALALQPSDDRLRMRLRTGLGFALSRVGDERGARKTFRRAIDSARAIGDVEGLASAAIGFASTMGLTGVVDEDGVRVLEDALVRLPEGDGVLRAQVMALLAYKLYFGVIRDRAERLAADAEAMAARLGDRLALGTALLARHYVLCTPMAPSSAGASRTSSSRSPRTSASAAWARGAHVAAIDALELGDIAAVDLHLEAYERRAADAGLALYVAHAHLMRAMRLLAARLADAEQLGGRALAIRPPDDTNNVAQFHAQALLDPARAGPPGGARAGGDRDGRAARRAADLARRARAAASGRRPPGGREARARRPRRGALHQLCPRRESDPAARDRRRGGERRRRHRARGRAVRPARAVRRSDDRAGNRHRAGAPSPASSASSRRPSGATTRRTRSSRARSPRTCARTPLLVAHAGRSGVSSRARGERAPRPSHCEAGVAQALGCARRRPSGCGAGRRAAGAGRDALVASLRKEGEFWTVAHAGEALRLKDSKGLAYLATLLAHPGREFHVLDLGGGESGDDAGSAGVAAQAGLRASDLGDAGEVLDANARDAYRRRLQDLRDALEEAERFNDSGRAERARAEMEFLAGELARGVGLGGRSRKAASAAERARQNVTRAILAVLRKIADGCPALGQHLQANVHTGLFCSYEPDPVITWITT